MWVLGRLFVTPRKGKGHSNVMQSRKNKKGKRKKENLNMKTTCYHVMYNKASTN